MFLHQFKKFHRELITELEKKTDMDMKYMNVSIVWFRYISLLSFWNLFKFVFQEMEHF